MAREQATVDALGLVRLVSPNFAQSAGNSKPDRRDAVTISRWSSYHGLPRKLVSDVPVRR